jgi:hypothetical protein
VPFGMSVRGAGFFVCFFFQKKKPAYSFSTIEFLKRGRATKFILFKKQTTKTRLCFFLNDNANSLYIAKDGIIRETTTYKKAGTVQDHKKNK